MKQKITKALALSMLTLLLIGCGKSNKNQSPAFADKYVDLHLHLDGSITVDIAKQLAQVQNITLPTENDEELKEMLQVSPDCTSLNEFLEKFALPCSLMQTPEGLSEAVRLVANNIKSQGVVYSEFRFAPQKHTDQGMTQEDAIKAALEGLKKTDLKVNLILCFMRGDDNDAENRETLELAKKYLVEDGGVVAVDLAGAEALFPTSNYADLFADAKEVGVPFTIHAGEADGADSVAKAISYGATRIGHGVRAYEDEAVVQTIKEKGIFLEMCPTSNVQTCAVSDMSNYPFMNYLNEGVRVTLNTDDMGVEGTTLANEYRYMENTFGLTAEQEQTLLRNSVDAAFTSQAVKDSLLKELKLK